MIATLLDRVLGTTMVIREHRSTEWAEGDLAHDSCRRQLALPDDDDAAGRFRFIVVQAEFEPGEPVFPLHRLNTLYPWQLLEQHGVEPENAIHPVREFSRPSWRMPDARELIEPQEAQDLLRIWEVTGVNFLRNYISGILCDVAAPDDHSRVKLRKIAEDEAGVKLDYTYDFLLEESEAYHKEVKLLVESAKNSRKTARAGQGKKEVAR